MEPAVGDAHKLFVGGLPADASEEDLRAHFARYGEVRDALVMRDRFTGRPRGFAFVSFVDPAAVDRALADPDPARRQICGREVSVSRARPRGGGYYRHVHVQQHYLHQNHSQIHTHSSIEKTEELVEPKKIFVGGLRDDVNETEFRNFFEQFGTITDVVVMYDNASHRSRGFGFITYEKEESAQLVLRQSFYELSGRMVEVKLAIPKDGKNGKNHNHNSGHSSRPSSGRGQVSYQSQPQYDTRYPYVPAYAPTIVTPYPYGGSGFVPGYYYGGYGGVAYASWNSQALLARGHTVPYGTMGYFPSSSDSGAELGNAYRTPNFSYATVGGAVYYGINGLSKVTQTGANLHPVTVNDTLASQMGALKLGS